MKVTKVHRVLEFRQSRWMSKYIELNTALRKQAKSTFEKDMFKLANNACYGKSFENVRSRSNIQLVSSSKKAKKLVAKPTFKRFQIINKDLTMIEMAKTRVVLNKPMYTGFTVLEASKDLMYCFHYDEMRRMFPEPDQLRLLFTDTGQFTRQI